MMKLGLVVALLLLAGPAAAQGRTLQLEVFLHEFSGGLHLIPESIQARVGETLQLSVYNQGEAPHNLIVCGDGSGPLEKCDDKWAATPNLGANESAVVSAFLKKGGTFDYYCSVPGHKGLGMTGVLHIAGDSSDIAKDESPSPSFVAIFALALALALVRRRRA